MLLNCGLSNTNSMRQFFSRNALIFYYQIIDLITNIIRLIH